MPFYTLSCPELHLERNEPPHWSTCLHVLTLTSFSYTLVSRPWTTLTDTKLPRRSSRTTSSPTYFGLSFVAYTLSIQSPSLAPPRLPYYTKPRPSRIMYLSTRERTPSIQCSFPQFNFFCLACAPFWFLSAYFSTTRMTLRQPERLSHRARH